MLAYTNIEKLVISDFKQASVHMDGVKMMIAMRGGIHKLSDDYQLRLMIFW